MAEIKVTSAELRNKAEELTTLNESFKSEVANLEDCEMNLASMWEGDAKTAFHTAFSNDKVQWENFSALIANYVTALQNIATEYDNKEAMNESIAGQRSRRSVRSGRF